MTNLKIGSLYFDKSWKEWIIILSIDADGEIKTWVYDDEKSNINYFNVTFLKRWIENDTITLEVE